MSHNDITQTVGSIFNRVNLMKVYIVVVVFFLLHSWMKLSFMLNVNKKIPVRR